MNQATAAPDRHVAPPLLPLALLVALGALAIGGGLGEGPLGPTFSGPGVADLDAPAPKTEERRAKRRAREHTPRTRAAARRASRASRLRLPSSSAAQTPRPPPVVVPPSVSSGSTPRLPSRRSPRVRPLPSAPSPGGGGGGGSGGGAPSAPPHAVDRLTGAVRGVVDKLPAPVSGPINHVLDKVLGPR